MASLRTQIYLTEEQRQRLDEIVRREHKSLAQVIREAIDTFLANEPEFDEVAWMVVTFGSDPHITVPPRTEWRRREERIWGGKSPR